MPKEKQSTEHHGAHSQIHKGSSEYGDGGNINHYLGNDDYVENNLVEDAFSSGTGAQGEAGKVAYGNTVEASDDDEEVEDKKLSEDEMVDEESIESFPASDPPGHFSKSHVDKEQHS